MGPRSLIIVAASMLSASSAMADLQLVPRSVDYTLDGVKLTQVAFSDGGSKSITYAPPSGWEYSGSATKLTLHPPNKPQAEGTISRTTGAEGATLDEETTKKLTDQIVASVPQGSTNVSVVSQEKNPLMIERKETFLVVVAYTFYGAHYKRSVMFLNRGKEQLRFEFVSLERDFDDLQRAFIGSQYSWQNL
jgi:hypothetical protein